MALSDWQILAFDEDGNPSSGNFILRGDAWLEVYKNWVYIHHPSAWFDGCGFTDGVVMQIWDGRLEYAGCKIVVARHAFQSACFVFVSDWDHRTDTYRFFAGIGCAAYLRLLEYIEENDPDRLRLLPDDWREDGPISSFYGDVGCGVTFIREGAEVDVVLYGPEEEEPERYVGVTPKVQAAFISWLGRIADEQMDDAATAWFSRVRVAEQLMYNQGDAFFAEHLDLEIPATPVGDDPGSTMLSRMIGDSGDDGEPSDGPESAE